ncbi:MAG: hypothetical protein NTW50_04385, partial [Candidatus Berkelbacteria bacterium]|nr:hypothetical protein [Candidatus Berkelbacteria bacterium]
MDKKLLGLRKFNIFMACLHFGQGIAMLLLSTNLKVPVTASFLKFDVLTKSLYPKMSTLFEIKLGPLVASFLFLSALAHF